MGGNESSGSRADVTIAAVVGVVDEVELIRSAIDNLRNVGVDYIVVVDTGSTDGTLDILASYHGDSDVVVHAGSGKDKDTYDNIDFLTPTCLWTLEAFHPDLIMLTDADEFWLPVSGNIKDTDGLSDAVLSVPRYNIPVVRDKPLDFNALVQRCDDQIYLITQPMSDGRMVLNDDSTAKWIMTAVQPKLLIRADSAVRIAMGGHRLDPKVETPPRSTSSDLIIAHAPFTSRDRFLRKVRNIQVVLSAGSHLFPGAHGWHWKRWAKIMEDGGIDAEYERQCLCQEEFAAHLASGIIQSVSDYFRR